MTIASTLLEPSHFSVKKKEIPHLFVTRCWQFQDPTKNNVFLQWATRNAVAKVFVPRQAATLTIAPTLLEPLHFNIKK